MRIPWKAGAVMALSLALASCDQPKQASRGGLPPQRRATPVELGSFTVTVDPSQAAVGPQFLEMPIQKDGLSGLNSPFTIELFSPLPATVVTNSPNCGGLTTYEASVRIKSYFQEELSNVYVEFTDIHGGASTVCNKLATAPDINQSLNPTPGILDYTNGNDPAAFNQSHIGAYGTVRTVNAQAKIGSNPSSASYPLPNSDKVWAFPIDAGQSPFTYTAHVVADIRPVPAALESPFVDAGGALYVFSYDPADPGVYGTDPGIAQQVNIQLYTDPGMTTTAGAQLSTTVDRTLSNAAMPGTGFAQTGSNTTGRAGSTLYVKLQNQWTSGTTPLYGVLTPEPAGNTVLVTRATTVNTGILGIANITFPMSTDPKAAGAEIDVRDGVAAGGNRITSCAANPNPLTLPARASGTYQWDFGGGMVIPALPTVFPRTDPGLGGAWTLSNNTFTSGHFYCYRVRNLFVGLNTGGVYPGAWSTWGSFKGP
jgi:hypothetical protein